MRGFMRDITAHPGRGRGCIVRFFVSVIQRSILLIKSAIIMPDD